MLPVSVRVDGESVGLRLMKAFICGCRLDNMWLRSIHR